MNDSKEQFREYVDKFFLARRLSISTKTIERHTATIAGRVKFGNIVRYHLPTIDRLLLSGRDILNYRKGAK